MVLSLLAQTVFVGDMTFGAITLFLFGLAMSFPVLVLAQFEGANRAFTGFARRWKAAFYHGAGLLLISAGVAELSPRVMGAIMVALDAIVGRLVPF
jgi:cytochrome c biogenesis protein CcdA